MLDLDVDTAEVGEDFIWGELALGVFERCHDQELIVLDLERQGVNRIHVGQLFGVGEAGREDVLGHCYPDQVEKKDPRENAADGPIDRRELLLLVVAQRHWIRVPVEPRNALLGPLPGPVVS